MRTKKLSRLEARALAERMGINLHQDFHKLNPSDVSRLLDIRKLNGYRKPANANGSTGMKKVGLVKGKLVKEHPMYKGVR